MGEREGESVILTKRFAAKLSLYDLNGYITITLFRKTAPFFRIKFAVVTLFFFLHFDDAFNYFRIVAAFLSTLNRTNLCEWHK